MASARVPSSRFPSLCCAAVFALGCSHSAEVGGGDGGGGPNTHGLDLAFSFPTLDMAGQTPRNECGDDNPTCTVVPFAPKFPLSTDPMPDPNEKDVGVVRDPHGYIALDETFTRFDDLWIANTDDWNRGTVSRFSPAKVQELARYASVTCYSNKGGSKQACDGQTGCCSRDDYLRFLNRQNGQPDGLHQAVQLFGNSPSRTGLDLNGDCWVANRSFGGQSSVTKFAHSQKDCVERNGHPGLQTSSDVNGDGVIDTDCNRNGVPDDLDDLKGAPCLNGKAPEYYGVDDECILFTTNTNTPNQYGRPLALAAPTMPGVPADAWAGTYTDGAFFRIDGATGLTLARVQMPNNFQPYGATIDAKGVLWAVSMSPGGLAYFDTRDPQQGSYPVPHAQPTSESGYGIALDRDQNIWIGLEGVGRFTPYRAGKLADLASGHWTIIQNPGRGAGASGTGYGIAADSRTARNYFVWFADGAGYVTRIDASAIPLPNGADVTIDGSQMPAVKIQGMGGRGVGVDVEQNVWSVSRVSRTAGVDSALTRIKVDSLGNMTAPDITNGVEDQGCPVGNGDRCLLGIDKVDMSLGAYTYSDFTGFGLRNFTSFNGSYQYVLESNCTQLTNWIRLEWDADVPPRTSLSARFRGGTVPVPDATWSAWSAKNPISPSDLNGAQGGTPSFLQVEFDLSTIDVKVTPALKAFRVVFECKSWE